MELRQCDIAVHEDTTPDEWVDAVQDGSQLVEAERYSRGHHVLRVTQCRVSLKDSPRYLALSHPHAARLQSRLSCRPTVASPRADPRSGWGLRPEDLPSNP